MPADTRVMESAGGSSGDHVVSSLSGVNSMRITVKDLLRLNLLQTGASALLLR